MADSSRSDAVWPPAAQPDGMDGDTRIEQLLLSGLDRYFAADYEGAISVWTRVLFLDRNHSRARAYIERARSAIAERQRESEELVHRGVDAFGRGDAAEARSLLISALNRGGPHEVAFTFLDRIDRLTQPPPPGEPPAASRRSAPAPRAQARERRAGRHRRPWLVPAVALGIAVIAGVVALHRSWDRLAPLLFNLEQGTVVSERGAILRELPPLPRAAELALARARSLQASGHLGEALLALEGIDAGDRLAADADRMRSEIQRALLAGADRGGR